MDKFTMNLTANNKAIKAKRVATLASQAKKAKRNYIDAFIEDKEALEIKLEVLYDLNAKSAQDLMYREDFNAKEFARITGETVVGISRLKLKIDSLEVDFNELFAEIKENK